MGTFLNSLQGSLGQSLPGVAGALLLLGSRVDCCPGNQRVLRKTLHLFKINDRINANAGGSSVDVASAISSGTYYVILMVVLLAVFNQLKLDVASEPIRQMVNKLFCVYSEPDRWLCVGVGGMAFCHRR